MQLRCCLVAALLAAGGAQAQGAQPRSGYPVGWNGLAETPPLGWRSWNAWNTRVSQANMEQTIDALVAKVWTTDGKANTSLLEAGYLSAGIDEGWEGCGMGVNGTQHAAGGNPVINTQKFPDMAGLVKHGHDAGLKIGWYENGCACGEKKALMQNYEGDVRQLHAFGFDGVKLDGCGAQRNLTLYAQLMNRTGKSYLIENCHFGRCTDWDNSSCPTAAWCPFNWYRTSGDINSSPMSWLRNLQTTIAFQDPVAPLSRPHCWAYPDMLEVGNINVNGRMHYEWNRAHFGAWSVISSPLILGMDVTQTERVAAVIDVITNKHAIAVNQAWHGHPGGLVWSKGGLPPWTPGVHYPAARLCNLSNSNLKQAGWSMRPSSAEDSIAPGVLQQAVVAPGGGCLEAKGSGYGGGRGGLESRRATVRKRSFLAIYV
jgi:alpha-galactosidase